MVPIRRRLSLLCLFSPFRAFGGCSSLANITVSYNNRWCTSYRYMDRQQTVGLTSGPVSHVQSPRMSRSNENNLAQVTGEDCPQNQKFWRKVPERRTHLRGKKEMRDSSLTGDHAKRKKKDLCLMSRTLPTEQLTRPVQQGSSGVVRWRQSEEIPVWQRQVLRTH